MSATEEIAAERDAMLVRSRRGAWRDDEYTAERWIQSLQSILNSGYGQRQLWIKIGAVSLRAIEAIDRRRG